MHHTPARFKVSNTAICLAVMPNQADNGSYLLNAAMAKIDHILKSSTKLVRQCTNILNTSKVEVVVSQDKSYWRFYLQN